MSGTHKALVLLVDLVMALSAGGVTFGCGGRTHPERDAALHDGDGGDGGGRCADCDDAVACTRDTCVAGACVHEPDDAICAREAPCSVPDCDPETGCNAQQVPDGTWCGASGADGAPPPVCDAGECMPQRVVGVTSWRTIRFEVPEMEGDASSALTHLARVADRDGDGIDDLAAAVVPSTFNGNPAESPATVGLYSFPSGETLWSVEHPAGELLLGARILVPGDLDGDGADDIVYRLDRIGAGWVRAVEASRGETLWEVPVYIDGLALVGDLDGDGALDLAAFELPYAGEAGALIVLSARTGDEIRRLEPDPADVAGYGAVVSLGDVDGDAIPDLAVSAEAADLDSSTLQVLAGADLSLLASWDEANWNIPVLALGDLTGDGPAELVIAEIMDDGTGGRDSAIDLWGRERIWTSHVRAWRQTYDLDLDGHGDFTGGPTGNSPRPWHSAATGEALFEAAQVDETGQPVSFLLMAEQVPDANGDGAEDWVIPYGTPPGTVLIVATELEVRR